MEKATPTKGMPKKGKSMKAQQGAQKVAQNIKNAARNLDID